MKKGVRRVHSFGNKKDKSEEHESPSAKSRVAFGQQELILDTLERVEKQLEEYITMNNERDSLLVRLATAFENNLNLINRDLDSLLKKQDSILKNQESLYNLHMNQQDQLARVLLALQQTVDNNYYELSAVVLQELGNPDIKRAQRTPRKDVPLGRSPRIPKNQKKSKPPRSRSKLRTYQKTKPPSESSSDLNEKTILRSSSSKKSARKKHTNRSKSISIDREGEVILLNQDRSNSATLARPTKKKTHKSRRKEHESKST